MYFRVGGHVKGYWSFQLFTILLCQTKKRFEQWTKIYFWRSDISQMVSDILPHAMIHVYVEHGDEGVGRASTSAMPDAVPDPG